MDLYLPIAEMTLELWLLVPLGLSVGLLSGLFGVGGGFILTPLLIVLGVPPLIAVGTGVSIVVASSLPGTLAHWHRGNVDIKMGLILVSSGIVGAFFGSHLQAWLKALGQLELFTSLTYIIVLGTIGTIMFVEGVWAWRLATLSPAAPPRRRLPRSTRGLAQRLPFRTRFRRSKIYISVLPPILLGTIVGLATVVMGAGGGFLLVPSLIYLLKLNTRLAIGTSSFQIMIVATFTTVVQSMVNHNVDISLGVPLMLGSVIGAQYGVRLGEQLKPELLRILLAFLVLFVGTRMALNLIVEPAELYNLQALTLPR